MYSKDILEDGEEMPVFCQGVGSWRDLGGSADGEFLRGGVCGEESEDVGV